MVPFVTDPFVTDPFVTAPAVTVSGSDVYGATVLPTAGPDMEFDFLWLHLEVRVWGCR